jgi:hypothetical protein
MTEPEVDSGAHDRPGGTGSGGEAIVWPMTTRQANQASRSWT